MLQRILLILAIVIGIASIAVTFTKVREHVQGIIDQRERNAKDRDSWQAKYKKTDAELKDKTSKLEATQSELADTQTKLTASENKANASENRAASLRTGLEKEKATRQAAQAELSKWLQVQLAPGKALTPELAVQVISDWKGTLDKNTVLEKENKVLAERGRILQDQLDQLFGDSAEVIMPAGLKAKITSVDPKWQFVVLDVGSNKGARQRGVFKVHRGDKLIGKVRVTTVMPDSSIANIMPDWTVDEIREGDQVLY